MGKKSPAAYFIPILLLAFLIALIWGESFLPQQSPLSGGKSNTPLPTFSLPNLFDPENNLTNTDLPKGKVFLFHIWASWCSACRSEHALLMKIHKTAIPIYSIDFKDNPQQAKDMLEAEGNPFTLTAMDPSGQTSRQWGVYGTPQTFVVDKQGIIRYRQVGAMSEETWNNVILPLINQYQQ